MKRRNRRGSSRSCAGELLVEMLCGMAVLIPIALAFLDIGALALGVIANENICRNAVRSAAAGPKGQLVTRANSIIPAASQSTGCFIWHQLGAGDISFNGPDSLYLQGSVSAKTRLTVTLPAPLPALPNSVDVYAAQAFPYTYASSSTATN